MPYFPCTTSRAISTRDSTAATRVAPVSQTPYVGLMLSPQALSSKSPSKPPNHPKWAVPRSVSNSAHVFGRLRDGYGMTHPSHHPSPPTTSIACRRLLAHEVAFVLQVSPWRVAQMRRKGRRLASIGLTVEQIAAEGGLPPTHRGNFPSDLLPLIEEEPLAQIALKRIREGSLVAPWIPDLSDAPRPLSIVFRQYR
jgi:hypothetical protein